MKLFEAVLYKLVVLKCISLEEAKILSALYRHKACSFHSLCRTTGLEENNLVSGLDSLLRLGFVSEKAGIYFSHDFEAKLLTLIDSNIVSKKRVAVAIA